jgi:hypothetical protein
MTTGVLLLVPFVPQAFAGAALTGFSSCLLGMYLRTPALHKPGSVWPTPQGVAVSKDVWMLGYRYRSGGPRPDLEVTRRIVERLRMIRIPWAESTSSKDPRSGGLSPATTTACPTGSAE